MSWLAAILITLAGAACYALGLWLGKRPGRVPAIAAAVCLLFLLLRAFLRYYPAIGYPLLAFDAYAGFHGWWMFSFAFCILGIGTRKMSTRFARGGIAVLAGLLFLFVGSRLIASAAMDYATFTGVAREDGVCRQTTGYSCGAAAAATLLAQLGAPATEREMAERCGAGALTGTDEFAVCRGLRQKLAGTGRHVRLIHADGESLRRAPLPALATVKFSFLVDHWVAVLEIRDDVVVVGDPLRGRVSMPRREFLGRWRGVLVTVERQ
jgi:predicted double-glycine peptidase